MGVVKDNIYIGSRVAKHRDYDVEEDSPYYVKDKDLPESVSKIAFPLDQVANWEENNDMYAPFILSKTEEILTLKFKNSGNICIVEKFESFTTLMRNYKYGQQTNTKTT